jgi:hypothetical protein
MLALVGSVASKCPGSGGPSVMYGWGLGGLPVVAARGTSARDSLAPRGRQEVGLIPSGSAFPYGET